MHRSYYMLHGLTVILVVIRGACGVVLTDGFRHRYKYDIKVVCLDILIAAGHGG
jgi:hypothetical protein